MGGKKPYGEKDLPTPRQAILKTELRRSLLWELLPLQPPAAIPDEEGTELPHFH